MPEINLSRKKRLNLSRRWRTSDSFSQKLHQSRRFPKVQKSLASEKKPDNVVQLDYESTPRLRYYVTT